MRSAVLNAVAVFITFFVFISRLEAGDGFSIILVDKATHQLHHAYYEGDQIKIKKTYHVTLGKALGDKFIEKDLKTPEGVYFFTHLLRKPNLKKKFGNMALLMNYPNPVDRLENKTGFDIMLHATDDPSRLKKDYDSEGCVVIDNHEIEEVSRFVTLGITPILVYNEFKNDLLRPEGVPGVKAAFENWLSAWKSKDIDSYIGSYVDNFRYNGMGLKQYRAYKKSLNERYAQINIDADDVRYFHHPKYSVVLFTQRYHSSFKNGRPAFRSDGTKLLYMVKQGDRFKIADENFTNIPQISKEQLRRLTDLN